MRKPSASGNQSQDVYLCPCRFQRTFCIFHVFLPSSFFFSFIPFFKNQSGYTGIQNSGYLFTLITWKTICALLWCMSPCSGEGNVLIWPALPFSSLPHSPSPTIWPWGHFCQRVGLGDGALGRNPLRPPSVALIPWGLANIRRPLDISPLLATNQELHLGGNLLWLKEFYFFSSMETLPLYLPFADLT